MKRMYIVNCSVCHRWCSVPSLELQSICREAGACLDCMKNDYFLLRVRIVAVEEVLRVIVRKGKALPEERREQWRMVYVRKTRQLSRLRAQLEELQVVNYANV